MSAVRRDSEACPSEVERLSRRRIRYVQPNNAAKVLGHRRYWSLPFLRLYMDLCDERLFDVPEEGYLLAQNLPELARRIEVGRSEDGHYPSSSAKASWQIRSLAVWGSACRARGELTQAAAAYATATRLAADEGVAPKDSAIGELAARSAVLDLTLGRCEDALAQAERALAVFRSRHDVIRLADTLVIRGLVRTHLQIAGPPPLADYIEAIRWTDPRDRRSRRTFLCALHNIVVAIYRDAGDAPSLEETYKVLRRLGKELARRPMSITKAKIQWVEGLILARLGTERLAWRRLRRARSSIRQLGDRRAETLIALDMAILCFDQGDAAKGRELLGELVADLTDQDPRLVDAVGAYLAGRVTVASLVACRLRLIGQM